MTELIRSEMILVRKRPSSNESTRSLIESIRSSAKNYHSDPKSLKDFWSYTFIWGWSFPYIIFEWLLDRLSSAKWSCCFKIKGSYTFREMTKYYQFEDRTLSVKIVFFTCDPNRVHNWYLALNSNIKIFMFHIKQYILYYTSRLDRQVIHELENVLSSYRQKRLHLYLGI